MFSVFSFMGFIYLVILYVFSHQKGILPMLVLTMILLVCAYIVGAFSSSSIEGVYLVNGPDGVPKWIFNPECLLMCPLTVSIIMGGTTFVEGLQKRG